MATESVTVVPQGRLRPPRRALWILYPILLFLTMAGWAVSSPVGSSPDEDFHLASAWCAWGTRPGLCEPGHISTTRMVPRMLLDAPCYQHLPDANGACPILDRTLVETDRFNFSNYYPNGFYAVMGLFAGPDLVGSVMGMRLLNSAIYSAGLAALLLLARPRLRPAYLLGSLVTLVPLGLFVVSSANPSSWAITSATLLWAAATEFAHAPTTTRRWQLGAVAVVALVLGVFSRADAAAYAALALVLAWFLNARLSRRTLLIGGGVVLLAVAAVLWALSLQSAQLVLDPADGVPQSSRPDAWFARLRELPKTFFGTFGTYGLGWLDTRPPAATWVLAGTVYVGVLFWGLRKARWRKATAVLTSFMIPAAIMMAIATARNMASWVFQPRYFLPVMILAMMVALAPDSEDDERDVRLLPTGFIVGALGVAQAITLHTNLRRYVTGLDVFGFNLDQGIEWWWAWSPSPMTVFWFGSIAFLGAALAVGHQLRSAHTLPRQRHSSPTALSQSADHAA